MIRRKVITLLGGAAAWPLAGRAEQAGKPPTIGYFGTSTPSAQSQWTAALVQRLRELGWIEERTVAVEYRWAEGRTERYAEIATELVRLKVDVIVTTVPTVAALKQATSVIPIVFALGSDPVAGGLVASLARPSGNRTLDSGDRSCQQASRTFARSRPPSRATRDLGQCRHSPNRAGDARG
jgi:putative ABC transport system substrate-binding protein